MQRKAPINDKKGQLVTNEIEVAVPHIPPSNEKQPFKAAFFKKGHIRDTLFLQAISRMQPPSIPELVRTNPKKYCISWNQDVPHELWSKFPRKRIRIRIYDNINRYKGEEREKYAEHRLKIWIHLVKNNLYDPFEEMLIQHQSLADKKEVLQKQISELKTKISEKLEKTPEELRTQTPVAKALDLFIQSRQNRLQNNNSISSYRGTISWLTKYFEQAEMLKVPISSVTRLHIANALNLAKSDNNWNNTTYNKEVNMAMTVFNWLALEDYIDKNPAKGKIEKFPEKKSMHQWYNREIAKKVKEMLIKKDYKAVYRACAFTYFLFIRSKSELMQLKVSDIDRTLKRIRFSAELSKNNKECYRDYPPDFDKILDDMDISSYPSNYYVFGKNGMPSDKKCHKDFLAEQWRPVRDELGLSDKFTIYGWKHTGIIHDLMKGIDGQDISYKARHDDFKTTTDYLRDYDISLKNIYNLEDLTF